MGEKDLLTDIVLLALFFLMVYTVTYLITHYPDIASFFHEVLSNETMRAIIALLMLPIGVIFLTFGIKYMLNLIGGGRFALGFILVALGVAIFLFSITTIVTLLWNIINNLINVLTSV